MRRLQRAIKREPRQSVSNIDKSEMETEVHGNARWRQDIEEKKITQASICQIVTLQIVHDYRRLNEYTVMDVTPLP